MVRARLWLRCIQEFSGFPVQAGKPFAFRAKLFLLGMNCQGLEIA
jgi:hypothetical protein